MKIRQPFCVFALFAAGAAAYSAGCSSSTTTSPSPLGGDSGSDGASSSGSTSGSSSGSGSTMRGPSGAADGGMTDQTCAMSSSARTCVNCCQSVHPMGIQNLVTLLQGCVCGSNGPCQMACASEYCMNGMGMPGDACDTCIQGAIATADGGMGVCYGSVSDGCTSDRECSAYVACINGCPAQ